MYVVRSYTCDQVRSKNIASINVVYFPAAQTNSIQRAQTRSPAFLTKHLMSLLNLSVDIWREQISAFILASDLCHLDSAALKHNLRTKSSTILCTARIDTVEISSEIMLDWICRRMIRFRCVILMFAHSETCIAQLAYACTHITALSCPTLDNMMQLTQKCAHLVRLRVEDAAGITSLQLRTIGEHCKHIEILMISSVGANVNGPITAALRSMPTLQFLEVKVGHEDDLAGVSVSNNNLQLSQCVLCDATLTAIADHFPLLQALSITIDSSITDHGIEALAMRCRELRSVFIYDSILTDGALHAFAMYSPQFTDFNIEGGNFSAPALVTMLCACMNLERIVLSNVESMSDAVIREIADSCKELLFFRLDNSEGGYTILRSAIVHLLQCCTKLMILDLVDSIADMDAEFAAAILNAKVQYRSSQFGAADQSADLAPFIHA